jgi:probable DNA metabolism protein
MRAIIIDDDFDAWRSAALDALSQGLAPESIDWRTRQSEAPALFEANADVATPRADAPQVRVSRDLAALLKDAAHFRDVHRWGCFYRVLWRWTHGDRSVASPADEDGARLYKMAKAVRRAQHDMIAYVRFRQRDASLGAPEYVAWYEPDHDVLAWGAEHFAARMGRSTWLIATPDGAAMFDGERLELERRRALASDHAVDTPDAAEALWMTYYRSIFNPARLNEGALEQHMPVRFWKGLPEGALIPKLVSDARGGARRVAARGIGAAAADGDAHHVEPFGHRERRIDAEPFGKRAHADAARQHERMTRDQRAPDRLARDVGAIAVSARNGADEALRRERVDQARDRRPGQAGASGQIADRQRVVAGPEGPQDFEAALQRIDASAQIRDVGAQAGIAGAPPHAVSPCRAAASGVSSSSRSIASLMRNRRGPISFSRRSGAKRSAGAAQPST